MKALPSMQDWDAWNAQAPTNALREYANSKIEGLKTDWANGLFTYNSNDATLMKNAEALGEIKAWTKVLELSYADLQMELSEDDIQTRVPDPAEHIWDRTPGESSPTDGSFTPIR